MDDHIIATDMYHTPNYSRFKKVFVKGEGVYLYDGEGMKYLDFLAGISVAVLGHSDPEVIRSVHEQARNLFHVSNLFYVPVQGDLLWALSKTLPWKGKVFFCNSGTEAVEAAIKLARKYSRDKGRKEYKILSFRGSFHGRTYGALSATAQEKYHSGFEPMLPGFTYVEMDDEEGFVEALRGGVCAVLFEPIQGEGGVRVFDESFLRFVCEEARKRDVLILCDEIQTGFGRTGRFFAFEHFGIVPDVLTLAKGMANGLPLGAMIAREDVAVSLSPGTHGSTFGGNPVSCAAAVEVVKRICDPDFLEKVTTVGNHLRTQLDDLAGRFDVISHARGMGLMQALVLNVEGKELVTRCLEMGLIINCTEERVLRFLPPLIVEKEHVDYAAEILARAFLGEVR